MNGPCMNETDLNAVRDKPLRSRLRNGFMPGTAALFPSGIGAPHMWSAARAAALLVLAAALSCSGCGKQRAPAVWAVTMVPLAETGEFQDKLERALRQQMPGVPFTFERKTALGDEAKLAGILKEADKRRAAVLVAIGADAAVAAYKETSRVPVVFCKVPYPKAYGLHVPRSGLAPTACLQEEAPMRVYGDELRKIRPDWKDAAIVLPKGYLGGEAEAAAFSAAFTGEFGGTVHIMPIDAKTCAQLMDVVSVYNMIASRNVSIYYAISDGNLAKYLGMLVRQCTARGIPVIGGGQSVIDLGGVLAAVPDPDAEAAQCARLVGRILEGETCTNENVEAYIVLKGSTAAGQPAEEGTDSTGVQ